MPRLPEAVQEEPDVHVGHAVADEKHGPSKRIGAELDIEWGIEREAVEVIRFCQDQRRIVVEVTVILYYLGDILASPDHVLGGGNLDERSLANLVREFQIPVIIGR